MHATNGETGRTQDVLQATLHRVLEVLWSAAPAPNDRLMLGTFALRVCALYDELAAQRRATGALTLDADQNAVHVDGERVRLTRREFDLLRHLVQRRGQIVSRATLMQDVWQARPPHRSLRTVDIHIYRLRTKLGPDWGRRIETIHGIGYCLSSATALDPDPM